MILPSTHHSRSIVLTIFGIGQSRDCLVLGSSIVVPIGLLSIHSQHRRETSIVPSVLPTGSTVPAISEVLRIETSYRFPSWS